MGGAKQNQQIGQFLEGVIMANSYWFCKDCNEAISVFEKNLHRQEKHLDNRMNLVELTYKEYMYMKKNKKKEEKGK